MHQGAAFRHAQTAGVGSLLMRTKIVQTCSAHDKMHFIGAFPGLCYIVVHLNSVAFLPMLMLGAANLCKNKRLDEFCWNALP
jgi:hypothetical protein